MSYNYFLGINNASWLITLEWSIQEANLWNTEKTDLIATKGLLEQRIAALERQSEELREKLHIEAVATRESKLENQQLQLERNSLAIQFNSFV